MTRFLDLNPTDEEIKELEGCSRFDVEDLLSRIAGSDSERFMIATLLAHRIDRKGAFKAIGSIVYE